MIPIFIITCDRLRVLEQSIRSYRDNIKTPFEIVIADFGSTFGPTVEYLKKLEREEIKVYWREKIFIKRHLNNISVVVQDYFKTHPASNYVVTDPDIVLDNVRRDVLEVYAHILKILPEAVAVGPMLRTDDIPDCYPKKGDAINWERHRIGWNRKHHSKKVKAIGYKGRTVRYIFAKIDTTFAMKRAGQKWGRYMKGIRVLPPYAAQHLDWYLDPKHLTPDQAYYMKHASRNISTWSF